MRSAFAYPISSPNAFTKSPEEPDEDVLSRQLGMERNQQGMTSGPVVDASTGPCVEEHGAKTTSETATQAGTCSNRPQKRVYKRAYQKLQEETARIVKGLTRRHHSSDLLTQAKSKTPNRPREETKRSRAPSPMRPLTLCSTDFEYWDTLPTSQFEVELITKRDVRRDEYEYIDVPVGESQVPPPAAQSKIPPKKSRPQPQRGGHRGRNKTTAQSIIGQTIAANTKKKTTIIPETPTKRRGPSRTTIVGGRAGYIGSRRSKRTSTRNLGSNDATQKRSLRTPPTTSDKLATHCERGNPFRKFRARGRGRPPNRTRASRLESYCK